MLDTSETRLAPTLVLSEPIRTRQIRRPAYPVIMDPQQHQLPQPAALPVVCLLKSIYLLVLKLNLTINTQNYVI